MAKLIQRLQDPAKSGAYRASSIDAVADALRGSRIELARVPLAAKDGLLEGIASALGFPGWFGGNWDALEDCLTDLSWRPAQGYVLVFEGNGPIPRDDLGVLIDVLGAAAEFWAAAGKPFFAVFIDPQRKIGLPDLFQEA